MTILNLGCPVLDAFQGRGSWFSFLCGHKSPALQQTKDGAPSITASALSRDTYPSDRRLRFMRSVFLFTYQKSFALPDQGSHRESCGGTLVPPAIYSIFHIRP